VTTVFSAFERSARAHGGKPFLQVLPEKIEYSYAEALKVVNTIARRYRAAVGAAVVPVNPDYRAAELDSVLAHRLADFALDPALRFDLRSRKRRPQ
jgi:hypothetical protein